jgi:dTDP-4-dehydrorhamnose 3,5-epimerase
MIPGEVILINGDLAVDDRGSVRFVNKFDFASVKRFYMVDNHQAGFIRAWHAHKNEGKYVMAVRGSAVVAAVQIDDWQNPAPDSPVKRYILSDSKPSVLWIPPGYANGFKTLTENARLIFFSTSTIEESRNDDYRWPPDRFGDVWKVVER